MPGARCHVSHDMMMAMGTRRRMLGVRCIIKRVIGFLLLGAIVNVAVAWGCVVKSVRNNPYCPHSFTQPRVSVTEEAWLQCFDERFVLFEDGLWRILGDSHALGFSRREYVRLPTYLEATPGGGSGPGGGFYVAWVGITRSGWPAKAMHSYDLLSERMSVTRDRIHFDSVVMDVKVNFGGSIVHCPLPLRPIWPGFAINTIFYAAFLWLLFAASGYVRRRFIRGRIKRGLCPACAYPVGSSEVCTECGAPRRRAGGAPAKPAT